MLNLTKLKVLYDHTILNNSMSSSFREITNKQKLNIKICLKYNFMPNTLTFEVFQELRHYFENMKSVKIVGLSALIYLYDETAIKHEILNEISVKDLKDAYHNALSDYIQGINNLQSVPKTPIKKSIHNLFYNLDDSISSKTFSAPNRPEQVPPSMRTPNPFARPRT